MHLPKLHASMIAIGAIICTISLGTPWWGLVSKFPEKDVHFGLWWVCFSDVYETSCVETARFFHDDTWLNAVRALVIFSVLLSLATLPLAVVSTVKSSLFFSTDAALLALAQTIAMLIGLAVFTGEIPKLHHVGTTSVGWSYGIGWFGVGFYITGTVCLVIQTIMLKRRKLYENIHQFDIKH